MEMKNDYFYNEYRLTIVQLLSILPSGSWHKVAHLFSLLCKQDPPSHHSPTVEDHIKISTDLASEFCPSHAHKSHPDWPIMMKVLNIYSYVNDLLNESVLFFVSLQI